MTILVKRLMLVSLWLLLLITTSCSSRPSESLVKEILQKQLDKSFPGICKIISFAKINGEGDSRHYTIYYKATVEILKTTDGWSTNKYYLANYVAGFKRWENNAKRVHIPIQQGERFLIEGRTKFRKTEKGWIRF